MIKKRLSHVVITYHTRYGECAADIEFYRGFSPFRPTTEYYADAITALRLAYRLQKIGFAQVKIYAMPHTEFFTRDLETLATTLLLEY